MNFNFEFKFFFTFPSSFREQNNIENVYREENATHYNIFLNIYGKRTVFRIKICKQIKAKSNMVALIRWFTKLMTWSRFEDTYKQTLCRNKKTLTLNVRKIMSLYSWNLIKNITKNSDEKCAILGLNRDNQVCFSSLLWMFSPIYFNSRWFLFMSPTAKNWSFFFKRKDMNCIQKLQLIRMRVMPIFCTE